MARPTSPPVVYSLEISAVQRILRMVMRDERIDAAGRVRVQSIINELTVILTSVSGVCQPVNNRLLAK